MRPLFLLSEMQLLFQFAMGGVWRSEICCLGCETLGGPADHQSAQYIDDFHLSHSIGYKHMKIRPIFPLACQGVVR